MLEPLFAFDLAFTLFVQQFSSTAFTLLMQAVSAVFSSAGVMAIVAWLYWSKREKESFYFASLVVLAALFSQALKDFFQRPRPQFSQGIQGFEEHALKDFSFPSGHATIAGGVLGYLEKGLKANWKVLLLAFALLMAFSRIYLGAHFLTDVVAGLVLGFFVGKLNLWFRNRTEHMHFRLSKFREELLLFVFVIASVAIVLFLKELVLAAVIIGYFAGYSLWKELRKEQSRKGILAKIIGFAVLGALYIASEKTGVLALHYCILLLMGFWVSFLYPWIFELFKHPSSKPKARKGKRH